MARISWIRATVAVAAISFAMAIAGSNSAHAKKGPLYAHSKTAKMTRKLCRGIGNTLFCWAEIPQHIFEEAYATDPFTGFFQGFGEGFKEGSKRLGFGLWETVTFFSHANRNYEPYMEPEFVMMDVKE